MYLLYNCHAGPVKGEWLEATTLTNQIKDAYEAWIAAGAVEQKAKSIVQDSSGVTVAAGVNGADITPGTTSTYGYNTIMAPTYLGLRYNAINLAKLSTTESTPELQFYFPSFSGSSNTPVQGDKGLTLGTSGMNFYHTGSNTADATLNSNGLTVSNGSIVLGTTSGTAAGNVTLSNKNFTRSINGTSHNDLRFAIGSKFGVASDGTLYATGGVFNNYSTTTEMNTAIGSAVDGIEVGGRNLLIENGNAPDATTSFNDHTIKNTSTDTKTYFHLQLQNMNSSRSYVNLLTSDAKKYTSTGHKIWTFEVTNTTQSNGYIRLKHNGSSYDVGVSFKFGKQLLAGDIVTISFDLDGYNPSTVGGLIIKNIKLEKGNKATDWTPAPEDVQAEIDAKKSVHTLSTAYSWSYSAILGYADEGTSTRFNVTSTSGVSIGDTVRLKVAVHDMSEAPVYIIGTVTAINSNVTLTITAHGLDTTVIDGGKILTNSIGANQIAANSIGTTHLTVSDNTNLAMANELYEASLPTGLNVDYLPAISGGYLVKKVATQNYLMVTHYMPNVFKQNDELYYEFYGKAAAAGSVSINCWGYTGTPSSPAGNGANGIALDFTTTEKFFSGTVKLANAGWNTSTQYLLGFTDNKSTKGQVYIRKLIIRRKSAGELIVDGSITTDKLSIGNYGNRNWLHVIDNSRNGFASRNTGIYYNFRYDIGVYTLKTGEATSGGNNEILENVATSSLVSQLQGKKCVLAIDSAKRSDNSTNWRVYVQFYASDLTWISEVYLDSSNLWKVITIPSNAVYARIRLRMSQTSEALASGVTFTVSRLRLTVGEVLQDWTLSPDDLYTDGDNMFTNSNNMTGTDYYLSGGSNGTIAWGQTLNVMGLVNMKGVKVTATTANSGIGPAQHEANMKRPFVRGPYTLSAWVNTSANAKVNLQPFWFDGIKVPNISKTFDIPAKTWTHISFTSIYDNSGSGATINGGYVYFVASTANDTCQIAGVKLEQGTKATGWSPSDQELAATATAYITDIDSKHGITVKPSDSTGNDYLQMNSTAIEFYRG